MPSRASLRPLTLALALVAIVLGACGDKSAPETTVPAGFVAVRDANDGFALGVPADWVQIPLPSDLDEFDAKAREIAAGNDRLRPAINHARQLLQYGGKMMAVSPDGLSIVNLTVDEAKEDSLEETARAVVPLLEENGATEMTQERVTTGAGPALRLRFRYPIQAETNEPIMADEVQYYVLHDGKSYVLTVINPTGDLAENVASTFRLR